MFSSVSFRLSLTFDTIYLRVNGAELLYNLRCSYYVNVRLQNTSVTLWKSSMLPWIQSTSFPQQQMKIEIFGKIFDSKRRSAMNFDRQGWTSGDRCVHAICPRHTAAPSALGAWGKRLTTAPPRQPLQNMKRRENLWFLSQHSMKLHSRLEDVCSASSVWTSDLIQKIRMR